MLHNIQNLMSVLIVLETIHKHKTNANRSRNDLKCFHNSVKDSTIGGLRINWEWRIEFQVFYHTINAQCIPFLIVLLLKIKIIDSVDWEQSRFNGASLVGWMDAYYNLSLCTVVFVTRIVCSYYCLEFDVDEDMRSWYHTHTHASTLECGVKVITSFGKK